MGNCCFPAPGRVMWQLGRCCSSPRCEAALDTSSRAGWVWHHCPAWKGRIEGGLGALPALTEVWSCLKTHQDME